MRGGDGTRRPTRVRPVVPYSFSYCSPPVPHARIPVCVCCSEELSKVGPARVESDTAEGAHALPKWLRWVGEGARGGRRAKGSVDAAIEEGGLTRGVAAQAVREVRGVPASPCVGVRMSGRESVWV